MMGVRKVNDAALRTGGGPLETMAAHDMLKKGRSFEETAEAAGLFIKSVRL
jgi:hypothetical protein